MAYNSKKRYAPLDRRTGEPRTPSNTSVVNLFVDEAGNLNYISSTGDVAPISETKFAVEVANAETPNGNAIVTIQASRAERSVFRIWFAATAYAAPADLGILTATTGTILAEHTDDALAEVITDDTGLAVLQLDTASDGTVHAMVVSGGGLVATDSAAITGNA